MATEIAVVTSSGRSYYELVTQLKRNKIDFLSLSPGDPIPFHVQAVLTIEKDKDKITHPNVFIYSHDDPQSFIERVIHSLTGKRQYHQLVLGIDPGKRIGFAAIGDGLILRTMIFSSIQDVVRICEHTITRIEAEQKIINIGNGNLEHLTQLAKLLDDELHSDVIIRIVEEKGTTKPYKKTSSYNRLSKDIYSAIRIAKKSGQPWPRNEKDSRSI